MTDVEAPAHAPAPARSSRSRSTLANTGERAGKQVVQVYAERAGVRGRPAGALAGRLRAGHALAPGQRGPVDVAVPTRLLAYWDDGWNYEPGDYTLRVGTSVVDLPLDATRWS